MRNEAGKNSSFRKVAKVLILLFCLTIISSATAESIEHKSDKKKNSEQKPKLKEKGGMVLIPETTFWMGLESQSFRDTSPIHQVHLKSFWIDKTEVTNEDFARFVKATGYKTIAEIKPDPKEFPHVPPEQLFAGALVFTPPDHEVSKRQHYNWWRYVAGASWQHPEGPQSNLEGRWNSPVVQIAFDDALAYAKWAKKRLPTEAEFECASRAGLDRELYAWGKEFRPNGKWMANLWQGIFPYQNTAEDGYKTAAPVKSFPPNAYGLYDMVGNVWEWCSDWYRPDYYATLPAGKIIDNPKGPESSYDPSEPGAKKRVQKGGSFLCTDQYCARYMMGSRGKGEISSGCNHIGFRCVKDR
ncbi:MAG: formylglycine-generating enzyme family protein [Candidatus Obscuribacterales bacterium]|nr:formylglycine-generating enzyme family protein [Candidatus Obscuribacterales bacterium]